MIYPLNEMLENLMESFTDPETGELRQGVTDETIQTAIEHLQMEHDEKVDAICSAVKNYKAEAEDIRVEKMRLAKRQKSAENKRDSAKRFLAWLLQGEKFKNQRHNLYYQRSEELVIDSREDLVEWCKVNAPGFLNEPTIRIDDLKKAMKNGTAVPFAHLQENKNMVVR